MNSKIHRLGLFLFSMVSTFLFAGGQSEAELRKELQEEHSIEVFPIAQTTTSIDYVFIREDTIIRSGLEPGEVFAEYNLRTKETRSISPPAEWAGRRIESIDDLYYDRTANILHSIVRERLPSNDTTTLYYLLHLDDDSWEEVPELRDIGYGHEYDPLDRILYINSFSYHTRGILVFDMESREFVKQIDFPDEPMGRFSVYSMYGDPLQILALSKRSDRAIQLQYYLFDMESQTGKMYPNIEVNPKGISLEYYIHIDRQRFLCLNRQKQYESEVMELDLEAETQKVVALESFPRELFFLQRVDETHYSFLIRSDDNWILLCIMEHH